SAKQAENAPKTANISPEWRATGAIVRKRHSFRHIPPNRLVVAGVQLTNLVLGSVSGGEESSASPDKKSLMEKFGDFKSLLPSKKTKEEAPKV
ncbi:hypothetical protein, partial [Parasphingorhabdus sp.]|uniref:hypothetical protein n=1 Tax=Parasphingorhabdus sp. TaxID=2709688 RepID=UPI0032EAD858